MAILSSKILIYGHSLYWNTLAYFLLFSPGGIQDSAPVFVLGEAMRIPGLPTLTPTPVLALTAFLLSLLSITDLLSTNALSTISTFSTTHRIPSLFNLGVRELSNIAALRFVIFGVLAAWIYLSKPNEDYYGDVIGGLGGVKVSVEGGGLGPGGLALLVCREVFTFAFLEMVFWFWAFTTVREESREAAVQMARLAAEQEEKEE